MKVVFIGDANVELAPFLLEPLSKGSTNLESLPKSSGFDIIEWIKKLRYTKEYYKTSTATSSSTVYEPSEYFHIVSIGDGFKSDGTHNPKDILDNRCFDLCVLFFDPSNKKSFEILQTAYNYIRLNTPTILVATQSDMTLESQVSGYDVQLFCEKNRIDFGQNCILTNIETIESNNDPEIIRLKGHPTIIKVKSTFDNQLNIATDSVSSDLSVPLICWYVTSGFLIAGGCTLIVLGYFEPALFEAIAKSIEVFPTSIEQVFIMGGVLAGIGTLGLFAPTIKALCSHDNSHDAGTSSTLLNVTK